jgi:hypothetical protein
MQIHLGVDIGELLTREFGQEPLKDIDPELAVCTGAAINVRTEGVITAKEEEKLAKTPEGQYILGNAYYLGERGKKQDHDMALFWFKQAAELVHVDAQYMLGLCYENGFGVVKNSTVAMGWLEKAALNGNVEAQLLAGSYYERGYGVEKDMNASIEFYEKAANQGSADAMVALGNIYSETNYDTAWEWYQKAYATGHEAAQNGMSAMSIAIQQKKKQDEETAARKAAEKARQKAEMEERKAQEEIEQVERDRQYQKYSKKAKMYHWAPFRLVLIIVVIMPIYSILGLAIGGNVVADGSGEVVGGVVGVLIGFIHSLTYFIGWRKFKKY